MAGMIHVYVRYTQLHIYVNCDASQLESEAQAVARWGRLGDEGIKIK